MYTCKAEVIVMVSSITVDDELRRKIKKIAAELDTTQGDVVAQAINLFAQFLNEGVDSPNPEARKFVRKAVDLRKAISWRETIRKTLKKPGPDIDEFRIAVWGDPSEDQSR